LVDGGIRVVCGKNLSTAFLKTKLWEPCEISISIKGTVEISQ
jgi:hypothetical protein